MLLVPSPKTILIAALKYGYNNNRIEIFINKIIDL